MRLCLGDLERGDRASTRSGRFGRWRRGAVGAVRRRLERNEAASPWNESGQSRRRSNHRRLNCLVAGRCQADRRCLRPVRLVDADSGAAPDDLELRPAVHQVAALSPPAQRRPACDWNQRPRVFVRVRYVGHAGKDRRTAEVRAPATTVRRAGQPFNRDRSGRTAHRWARHGRPGECRRGPVRRRSVGGGRRRASCGGGRRDPEPKHLGAVDPRPTPAKPNRIRAPPPFGRLHCRLRVIDPPGATPARHGDRRHCLDRRMRRLLPDPRRARPSNQARRFS